jgi:hypothetical protein
VHLPHGLDRELLEQSIFGHRIIAAMAFFDWLKDEMHGAVKVRFVG